MATKFIGLSMSIWIVRAMIKACAVISLKWSMEDLHSSVLVEKKLIEAIIGRVGSMQLGSKSKT